MCKNKETDSFCGWYSQNIFVHRESTVHTNAANIVEVSTVMTAISTSVRELPREVPCTAWQYKVPTSVVRPNDT